MRIYTAVYYFFLLLILNSCSPKIPPIESSPEEPVPLPMLKAHMLKQGSYNFSTENIAPDLYYLIIRNEVQHLEDRQEVIIKSDGKIAFMLQPQKDLTVTFTPKVVGESFDVHLATLAGKSLGYAHIVPYPVAEVHENGYSVTGEILNASAEFFFFHAEGFIPHEEVIMIAGSNGLGQTMKLIATDEGELYFIQNPASQGGRKGNGYIYLLGKNGGIEVKYPWGTNLLHYSKAFFQIENDCNY